MREHVEEAQGLPAKYPPSDSCRARSSLATACTGGLIVKEAARFHAEGMSAAAFRRWPARDGKQRGVFFSSLKGAERTAAV